VNPKSVWIGLVHILLLAGRPAGAAFPAPDIDGLILEGQQLTLSGQYAEALRAFAEVLRLRPSHPAGYFYQAAVWERWMEDEQDDSAVERFYASADSAIYAGERLVGSGTIDPWVYTFLGAAYGIKGVREALQGRWWAALRDGWRGVGRLRKAVSTDPGLGDAYVGIGTYMYWRSRLTKEVLRVPIVKDEREEGIRLLRIASEQSRYSQTAARCQLVWILIKEERFTEASEIAQPLYAAYPQSSVVIFGCGAALLGAGDLVQAEKVYSEALQLYEDKERPHPFALECRWGLAKIYFRQNEMSKAESQCRWILEHNRELGERGWSRGKLRQVGKLLKETKAAE